MNCFARGCDHESVDEVIVATPPPLAAMMADPPDTLSLPLCADHLAVMQAGSTDHLSIDDGT